MGSIELMTDPKYQTPDMTISIPIIERTLGKKIRGVIHIGANYGEESNWYRRYGVDNVIWIEPLEFGFSQLKDLNEKYGDLIFNCAISNEDGNTPFYQVHNVVSSSLRPVGRHNEMCQLHVVSNHLVPTWTLSSLIQNENIDVSKYNMLNIDTQGTEDLVLQGAEPYLSNFDALYVETNVENVYVGTPDKSQIDLYLSKLGFREMVSIRVNPLQFETVYLKV